MSHMQSTTSTRKLLNFFHCIKRDAGILPFTFHYSCFNLFLYLSFSLSAMKIYMRSFAVVSLLLLVSLSTDMCGPLVVDATRCNWDLCRKYCLLLGKPACCPGPSGPCRCTGICPRITSGPLVVGAQFRRCDFDLCKKYCSLQGLPGCCSGFNNQCVCAKICPQITEQVMAGATDEEPFIEEIVIA